MPADALTLSQAITELARVGKLVALVAISVGLLVTIVVLATGAMIRAHKRVDY